MSMSPATGRPAALRRALLLDATFSGVSGLILAAGASPLASLLGLPVGLLRWAGILLFPFTAFVVMAARRADPTRDAVVVILGNALWVVASVLLIVSDLVAPTPLGEAFLIVQAAAVAFFGYLEYRGLRRAGAHPAALESA